MKKFVFSLQKVLELKNQLFENMKIELTNLNRECEKIEIFIKCLKIKFAEIENEYVEKSYKAEKIRALISKYLDFSLQPMEK